jgi:hypothetical protein
MQYYASRGQRVKAADWLGKLVRSGFDDFNRIYNDSILANVIGYKNFINTLKESKAIKEERGQISKCNIKTKIETEYKYSFGKKEETGKNKYLYKYSKNGTLTEKILLGDNDKESWKWRYIYDKNNNITEIIELNAANKPFKNTKYKYDARFNLLSVKQTEGKNNIFCFEFTYGNYDNIISGYCEGHSINNKIKPELFGMFDNVIKIQLDSFGNIIERTVFYTSDQSNIKQKTVTTTDSDGRILEIKEFNGNGSLESSTRYSNSDEPFIGSSKNKVDFVKYIGPNLVLKKETSTAPDGRIALIKTLKYDTNGNCILEEYQQLLVNNQPPSFPSFTRISHSFDKHSNELEYIWDTPDGTSNISRHKYENDLLVESYIYTKDFKTSATTEYGAKLEYTSSGDFLRTYNLNNQLVRQNNYDSHGNLVEKIEYLGTDPYSSVQFSYSYYK